MGNLLAPSHLLIIIIFALLFFGPTRLPELGRAFGKTVRAFKDGINEADSPRPSNPETGNTPPLPDPEKTQTK